MANLDKIKVLGKQLFPSGRAFKMPTGGVFDKLNTALAKSEYHAFESAISILYDILPDNDSFSEDDATDWERRLGMIVQSTPPVLLADRKLAIKRHMAHPGEIKARQHYLYLEGQLQAAGFDVYVYENNFSGVTKSPDEFTLTTFPSYTPQHGEIEHGEVEHGNVYSNKVVNSINQEDDDPFDYGDNLRSTFFIGGTPAGSYANVDADREAEFRQLILKIKPAQTVGFLLINYV